MRLLIATLFITFLMTTPKLYAQDDETCSRIATVNYQEVLVDANSSQKGEGLRFYLEKDKIAESYLDAYQEGSHVQWHNAVMGTTGTGLIIAGLFTSSTSNNKESLLIGGAAMILVNFLISKTQETANEKNLRRAIDEYNQRNLPRINFGEASSSYNDRPPSATGVALSKTWDF
jgi:hypothetical protein